MSVMCEDPVSAMLYTEQYDGASLQDSRLSDCEYIVVEIQHQIIVTTTQ